MRRRQRGQELVEFALIASIVLIFLFGIIDWGIAFMNYETLAQRAAWAARYASATKDLAGAQNIVVNGVPSGTGFTPIGLTGDMVTIDDEVESTDEGTFSAAPTTRRYVVVTISGYQYQMFTPFVGVLIQPSNVVAAHVREDD